MASRALTLFLSKRSNTSLRELTTVGCIGGWPGGARSSESVRIVSTVHPSISARCPDSLPSGMDFFRVASSRICLQVSVPEFYGYLQSPDRIPAAGFRLVSCGLLVRINYKKTTTEHYSHCSG